MTKDIVKGLYHSYKSRCISSDDVYIGFEEFKKVHEKARRNVLRAHRKNKREDKIPVCIMRLDDKYLYWVEIVDEKAVVNFIDNIQFEALFSKEIQGGRG
jgi:hypothetical protein